MKEIIAIIRPKKMKDTKNVLETLGFPGVTASYVLGRGKQRGIASELNLNIPESVEAEGKSGGMKYIPKRFVNIMVPDNMVDEVVNALIKANQTDQVGDGKIFVCPIDDAIRVRTDETGDAAIN